MTSLLRSSRAALLISVIQHISFSINDMSTSDFLTAAERMELPDARELAFISTIYFEAKSLVDFPFRGIRC